MNHKKVTLSQFFKEQPLKSTQLFREFTWILETKFNLNSAQLVSGVLELSDSHQKTLKDWVKKKEDDYPLQYFLGQVEFFGLNFYVEPGALIPRLETEEIASWAVSYNKENKLKTRAILDIGAGTGCLGLSVFNFLSDQAQSLTMVEPFERARRSLVVNTKSYGQEKTTIIKDKFEDVEFEKRFDLILSNPPYIKKGDEEVQSGVYKHEPHEALFAGERPVELICQWVERAYRLLNQNGLMVFEIGYTQRSSLEKKLHLFKPHFLKDSFGKDRFFYIINR